MKTTIGITLTIISALCIVFYSINSIKFNQNCSGFLKRAADANTVELALKELNKTIGYVEKNNLTTGYTSIMYNTPNEDIEFWYNNLKECQDELSKITSESSSLEKTNLLMKLRETLTDNGSEGTDLTIPDGLARYPDNISWGLLLILGIISFLGVVIWFLIENS